MNAPGCHRVHRQVAHLAALAMHLQMLNTTALLDVAHLQQGRFFAAQAVIKKNSQYCPVALPFQGCFIGRLEQRFGLVIAQCRRLAFVAFYPWSLNSVDGIAAGDRVALQQVIKEAGQRGQFAPDGRARQTAMLELGTPGQNMRSGHHTRFIGRRQTDKLTEVFQVILLGMSSPRVFQIRKPLDRRRDLSQRLKFDRSEPALIVMIGFRQLLHIILIIGSFAIIGEVSVTKTTVNAVAGAEIDQRY